MANICEQCGKKVGIVWNEPMELLNGKILCYACAEPIQQEIENLKYKKTKQSLS